MSADRMRRVHRNRIKRRLVIFGVLALLLLAGALFGETLCPFDPYAQDLSNAKAAPSLLHPFGTDRYGRDLLSRVLAGGRTSIFSALILVFAVALVGTAVGVFCGWRGGRADAVLMRISDLFLAFPNLVFAMAVAAVLGGGIQNAVLALGAVSWPKYARLARSQTMVQKESTYVQAAILSGCGTGALLFRHLLPNILSPLLVTAMLDVGTVMMELAGLSFLGLGAKPPVPEWGSMVSDSRNLLATHPWIPFAPSLAIFVSVLILNLLGDAVRDWLDPRNGG